MNSSFRSEAKRFERFEHLERFERTLRPKPSVNHGRRKLPETIHILKSRFSEPGEFFFEIAVVVRAMVRARGRRADFRQVRLATAGFPDKLVEVLVSCSTITFAQ